MMSSQSKNDAHRTAAPYALLHHPDIVERPGLPPIGRHVAGRGMLNGIFQHTVQQSLHAVTEHPGHADHFTDLAAQAGWKGEVAFYGLDTFFEQAGPGTLVLPGPSLAPFAQRRASSIGSRHALCGLTHTMATAQMVNEIYQLFCVPLMPGDTIICTSKAVRDVVRYQFDRAIETGWAPAGHAPDLPVIPLGINCASFASSSKDRALWRKRLKLDQDDIMLLSIGRLATFEKLHPAPLFSAVQRASSSISSKLHLMMCGWFQDDREEQAHREMAAAFAPDIRVTFPNGRDEQTKLGLLRAADMFVFPVDNIQETFGLAPVEAMAAGLPVVASDWNGLSETIVDGETGLKAATFMAAPRTGDGLAEMYTDGSAPYPQYLGSIQQRVAVDLGRFSEAIVALAADPEKRKAMGAAARRRAREAYDWSVIVPQLEELWAAMAQRARGAGSKPFQAPQGTPPSHPNPLLQYRGYASAQLTSDHLLRNAKPLTGEQMLDHIRLTGATLPDFMPVSPNLLLEVSHKLVRSGTVSVGGLAEILDHSFDEIAAAVIWLAKFNLVQISSAEERI